MRGAIARLCAVLACPGGKRTDLGRLVVTVDDRVIGLRRGRASMSQEVHMTRIVAAAVVGLSVAGAFAAGAFAQTSRTPPAVTLHIVSPTGEATTLAIDQGDVTLAVADNEVRLAVKGAAHVRPASANAAALRMTNPTFVFSRPVAGSHDPVFELSADQITRAKPERR